MQTPDSANPDAAAMTNHKGMTISALETAKFWADIAVVTLGLFAAAAGVFALYLSSRLDAAKAAELATFQTESKVAIASADARGAEANEEAAGAAATAAAANERAGQLELRAAQQQERAATAERQLLELQQRLAPRTLSQPQRDSIAATLRLLGTFAAQVFTYSDVTEVARIGDNVAATLNAAGWRTGLAHASGGVTVTGIVVAASRQSAETRQAAITLVGELRRNGIDANMAEQPMEDIPGPGMSFGNQIDGAQIRVLIGTK